LTTTSHEIDGTAVEHPQDVAAAPRPRVAVRRRAGLPRHLADDALRRRMLATVDAIAVLVATAASGIGEWEVATAFWAAALLPVWIVLAKLHGLYDRDDAAVRHLTVDELGSLLTWATVGTALTTPRLALTPTGAPSLGTAARMWLALVVVAPLLRGLARAMWRRLTPPSEVLLIGSGPLEKATRRKLELFRDMHMRVAGQLGMEAIDASRRDVEIAGAMRAACGGELPERVIVCTESVSEGLLADLVTSCRKRRIRLSLVPPLRGAFGTAVRLSHVAELPFVEYHTGDPSTSTQLIKRWSDVAIAAVALTLALPLLLVIAVAIKLTSRGPVLYVQRRAGLHGDPFGMLKFRTMVDGADARLVDVVQIDELTDPMFKLRDDPRVTRVGRFLRRWSLDELPQLVNVLRGEMSLVGPRPEQLDLVDRYRPEHRFRIEARPGMTGPMQVFGRGDLEFDERLAVEREYIENVSLARDVRILLMTFAVVISGKGAF
jgi:exopolysaccharide biosynthesis polyprenyl glycosylphosphotransferase